MPIGENKTLLFIGGSGGTVCGITTDEVAAVLGAASRDVYTLCTHPGINRWARNKPCLVDTYQRLTDAQRRAANCGLVPPAGTSSPQEGNWHERQWAMEDVGGGICRIADFHNYYSRAKAPVAGQGDIAFDDTESSFRVFFNNPERNTLDNNYGVRLSDLGALAQYYLCLIVIFQYRDAYNVLRRSSQRFLSGSTIAAGAGYVDIPVNGADGMEAKIEAWRNSGQLHSPDDADGLFNDASYIMCAYCSAGGLTQYVALPSDDVLQGRFSYYRFSRSYALEGYCPYLLSPGDAMQFYAVGRTSGVSGARHTKDASRAPVLVEGIYHTTYLTASQDAGYSLSLLLHVKGTGKLTIDTDQLSVKMDNPYFASQVNDQMTTFPVSTDLSQAAQKAILMRADESPEENGDVTVTARSVNGHVVEIGSGEAPGFIIRLPAESLTVRQYGNLTPYDDIRKRTTFTLRQTRGSEMTELASVSLNLSSYRYREPLFSEDTASMPSL